MQSATILEYRLNVKILLITNRWIIFLQRRITMSQCIACHMKKAT